MQTTDLIAKFKAEAIEFEWAQNWHRAAIRWEHCARISQPTEQQGELSYSAFFCYKRADDRPKALAMIDQAKKRYTVLRDETSLALCRHELDHL